jgi:hypothetical protein
MQETRRRYFQQHILRCIKPFCSIEYVMQGRLLPYFFKEMIYGILIDIIISYAVLDFWWLYTKPKHVAGFELSDK